MRSFVLERLETLLSKYKTLKTENKNLKDELRQLKNTTLPVPLKNTKKVKNTKNKTPTPSLFE